MYNRVEVKEWRSGGRRQCRGNAGQASAEHSHAMATDSSETERILHAKREKRRYVVEETLKLIGRAEEKRLHDKESRRRWTRILIRLEDSLVEAQKAVAECDTLIDVERGRRQETTGKSEAVRESAPTEPQAAGAETDPERRAAYRISDTPVEALADISLEDTAFAWAYMERREFDAHDEGFKKMLAAKLELAGQLPRALEVSSKHGERRTQLLLRQAITRMQAGQIGKMSDHEIELLVNCYTVLRNKIVPTESNKRLLTMIARTIGDLRAEGVRRRLFPR